LFGGADTRSYLGQLSLVHFFAAKEMKAFLNRIEHRVFREYHANLIEHPYHIDNRFPPPRE